MYTFVIFGLMHILALLALYVLSRGFASSLFHARSAIDKPDDFATSHHCDVDVALPGDACARRWEETRKAGATSERGAATTTTLCTSARRWHSGS